MNRQKAISNKLLLGAIFTGLNLLCFLGVLQGRRVVHQTRVNYSHIPAHGPRRQGSRCERTGLIASVDAVIEHAAVIHPSAHHVVKVLQSGPSAGSLVASVPVRLMLPSPEASLQLLARENVLALGSAPRAPGLGRAPPIA